MPGHVVERGATAGDFRDEPYVRGIRDRRFGMRRDRLEIRFGGRTERDERGARERDRARAPADRIGESDSGDLGAQHHHRVLEVAPDDCPAGLAWRFVEAK